MFINKVREEHDQIINQSGPGGARQLITLTSTIRIYIYSQLTSVPRQFSSIRFCSFGHYITDSTFSIQRRDLYWEFFVSSVTSAGPRLTPFPPVTAAEHQASLRPPLCSTSRTLSTTQRLNFASIGKTSNFFPDDLFFTLQISQPHS